MKISDICIRRPVLAWVLTLIVILVGIVGFTRLPVQKLPNIESVFLTIETHMSGAGPDIIEAQITRIIEESISGVEGIEAVSSVSQPEESKILVEFRPGRGMDNAVNDIRDRLARCRDQLPQDGSITEPVIVRNRADERPIIALALTSDKAKPSELFDYAENEIKKDLESIPGVARVETLGASKYVMKIDLDPIRMSGHRVNVYEVYTALKSQNQERPAGRIVSKNRQYNITTVANLEKPEEFNEVIVRQENQRLIRIKDIGRAYIEADDKRTRTRFNGDEGIELSVSKQSNANPLEVASAVKKAMLDVQKHLPEGYKIAVATDTTKFIEKSIKNVYWSIAESTILVILVVLIFLRSARASIIPLITIPVSILGVCFLMYLIGFSINNFTLFAMVLAIGLVVDDAIVVLENIHRHIENGASPYQAAFKGMREVGFSVIAMTLTLVAVYAPIPLGSGKMAKFFTEFAITLAGSVLISGFIALTLSPMMCSRLLSSHGANGAHSNGLSDGTISLWNKIKSYIRSDIWLDKLETFYENLLIKSLAHRMHILGVAFATSLLGIWVCVFLRFEYFPPEDTRSIFIDVSASQSATLEYTERHINDVDKILASYPEIERRISSINNPTATINAELTDTKTSLFQSLIAFILPHKRTTDEIIADLRKKFEVVTGLDLKIRTGGTSETNSVEFVIRGNKTQNELKDLTSLMVQALYQSGIVQGVRAASNNDNEDYIVTLQRDKISNIKKEPKDVADTIEFLIKGHKAGEFKRDNKKYDVRLQVADEFKQTPDDILKLFMRAGTEKAPTLIPFSELVSVDARTGPHEIHRYNRTRSSAISIALKPGNTVGDGVSMVENVAKETMPNDARVDFTGETKKFITESKSMILVFTLALCFIYLVMAAQFESWRDPFIIFFSVPLSLVGGIFALSEMDQGTLNLYSFIGFVTLVGLITKHGILIVDFANRLRDSGNNIHDAVVKAARQRLRPILMTTCAMVLGAVPLMFGGIGNESRRQLGSVIIGGMTLGTLFTIFVVPVVYTYLTSRKRDSKHNKMNHMNEIAFDQTS